MKIRIKQENLDNLKKKEFIESLMLKQTSLMWEVLGNLLDQDGNSI